MTTKSLARICEMGRSGACLKEIAQDTGYCISTVGKWLRHQGIGPPGRKYIPRRIYTVYKTKTTEFLVEGNPKSVRLSWELSRRASGGHIHGAIGEPRENIQFTQEMQRVRMCHEHDAGRSDSLF